MTRRMSDIWAMTIVFAVLGGAVIVGGAMIAWLVAPDGAETGGWWPGGRGAPSPGPGNQRDEPLE